MKTTITIHDNFLKAKPNLLKRLITTTYLIVFAGVLILSCKLVKGQGCESSTICFPPLNAQYKTPNAGQIFATYPVGSPQYQITDFKAQNFGSCITPSFQTGSLITSTFTADVSFIANFTGGAAAYNAPAVISLRMIKNTTGAIDTWNAEMVQCDISGGNLPTGILIRESTIHGTYGTITMASSAGGYTFTSFFDVFTELTIDGGQSWFQSAGGSRNIELSCMTATLNLKLFLEGYYQIGGTMASPLFNSGLTANALEVDNITVKLINPVTFAVEASITAMLHADGWCQVTLPFNLIGGMYYIDICHRNTLQTLSATQVAITPLTQYDFSTAANKAYNSNMKEVEPGVWALFTGDINHDCIINALDLAILNADIINALAGYLCTDLNGNGFVDQFDFNVLHPNILNGIACNYPTKLRPPCAPCTANDGNLCTIDSIDATGTIIHIPVNTEDGNLCTNDYCDPLTGIITHDAIYTTSQLDDNNPCTIDYCNTLTGLIVHDHIPGCSNCVCDSANLVPSLLINTGFDRNTSSVIPAGQNDNAWKLTRTPSFTNIVTPASPFAINYNCIFPNPVLPNSQWISAFNTPIYNLNNAFNDPYTFEFPFCLCQDDSLSFNFSSRADDSIKVYIGNEQPIILSRTGILPDGTFLYDYNVPLSKGRHAIKVDMFNTGGGCFGFNISGTISGNYLVQHGFCDSTFIVADAGPDQTVCAGSCATLSTQAAAGATYSWYKIPDLANAISNSNTAIDCPLTNQCYLLIANNGFGCSDTDTVCVMIYADITLGVQTYDASTCGGLGSFVFMPGGGTPPYSITTTPCPVAGYPCTFSNINSGFATLQKYPAGTYTIYITDANGCTISTQHTIGEPAAPSISITPVNPVCCGDNGKFNLVISGGIAPYTIQVATNTTPFQLILQTYTGINSTIFMSPNDFAEGTYRVYVIDANGCVANALLIISNPSCVTANVTTIPTTCNDPCNGHISAFGTGGTPFDVNQPHVPYNISIVQVSGTTPQILYSSGELTDNPYNEYADNLCEGDYLITVTDANGCVDTALVSITSPPPPPVDFTLDIAVCSNYPLSNLNATPSGGTFTSTNNCVTADGIFNPAAAVIGLNTITYSRCGATITKTIKVVDCGYCELCEKPGPELVNDGNFEKSVDRLFAAHSFFHSDLDNNCKLCVAARFCVTHTSEGLCVAPIDRDKFKDVSGHGPQNDPYLLINGHRSRTKTVWQQSINNIQQGKKYTFSFWLNTSIRIREIHNPQLQVVIGTTEVFNQTNIDTDGEWKQYTAEWTGGSQSTVEIKIRQIRPNGPGGRDFVYGIDDISMRACEEVELNVNLGPDIHIKDGQSVQLNAIVNSENGILSYSWSPTQQTTKDITVSPSIGSMYILTVIDSNGCKHKDDIIVYVSQIKKKIDYVLCFGGNDGSITIEDCVGTPPFSYLWSNGAITPFISNLSAGVYYVTVTDSNGITFTDTTVITESPPFVINSIINNTCDEIPTGYVELDVSGATPPYSYLWNDSSSNSFIYNLSAGSYSVTVSDANGCSSNAQQFTIVPSNACLGSCCDNGNVLTEDTIITFENAGVFATDFGNSCICDTSTYCITTNAQNKCAALKPVNDATTGSGNFLVVEGSPTTPNKKIWSTTMNVVAGQKYAIEALVFLKLDSTRPALSFCYVVDNTVVACYDSLSLLKVNEWIPVATCFTAAVSANVDVAIVQNNLGGAYGFDDITLFRCVPVIIPVVTSTNHVDVCPGYLSDSIFVTVVGGYPPIEIIWDDGFIGSTRFGLPVGTYPFTVIDNLGTIVEDSIVIDSLPTITGPITGTYISACLPAVNSASSYSIPAIAGATYIWSVPVGKMTINSGQGTNAIIASWTNVAINNGIVGQICVTVMAPCGTQVVCIDIDLNSVKPVTPGSISGPAKVCQGDVVTYSVAAVTRASSYNWTLPVGMSVLSGTGTNVITVNVSAAYIGGTVRVTASNVCGVSNPRTKAVSLNNLPASIAISGPASGVCAQSGVMYSAASVIGASSYIWTVPTGCTITNGQGTATITVNFTNSFTSGVIAVAAVNGCGTGAVRTLTVKGSPATPGPIIGSTTVCTGGIYHYNVSTVAGTNLYTWTAPGTIITGQGTKDIDVQYGAVPAINQSITVTAGNSCGVSAVRTLSNISIIYCVRIGESDYDVFTVYPNPAHHLLEVRYMAVEEKEYSITITDSRGRTVVNEKINSGIGMNDHTLDVTNYHRGLYLIQLTSGDYIQFQKVVLE